MLKEVEANGQIELGRQFAGRRYVLHVRADGRVELVPVPPDAGLETDVANSEWAEQNTDSIEQYNAWANQREPYSQRVRRWRAQQPG
jgi:hypothetical protein